MPMMIYPASLHFLRHMSHVRSQYVDLSVDDNLQEVSDVCGSRDFSNACYINLASCIWTAGKKLEGVGPLLKPGIDRNV